MRISRTGSGRPLRLRGDGAGRSRASARGSPHEKEPWTGCALPETLQTPLPEGSPGSGRVRPILEPGNGRRRRRDPADAPRLPGHDLDDLVDAGGEAPGHVWRCSRTWPWNRPWRELISAGISRGGAAITLLPRPACLAVVPLPDTRSPPRSRKTDIAAVEPDPRTRRRCWPVPPRPPGSSLDPELPSSHHPITVALRIPTASSLATRTLKVAADRRRRRRRCNRPAGWASHRS